MTAGGATSLGFAVGAGMRHYSVFPAGSANPWKCKTLILIAARCAPGQATGATVSAMEGSVVPLML